MYDDKIIQLYVYEAGVETRLPWCFVGQSVTLNQQQINPWNNITFWSQYEILAKDGNLYYANTDLDPAPWDDSNFTQIETGKGFLSPFGVNETYEPDSFIYDTTNDVIRRNSVTQQGAYDESAWPALASSTPIDDVYIVVDGEVTVMENMTILADKSVGWFDTTPDYPTAGSSVRHSYALIDPSNFDSFTAESSMDGVRRLANLPDYFTHAIVGFFGGSSFAFDADSPTLTNTGMSDSSVSAAVLKQEIDTTITNGMPVFLGFGGMSLGASDTQWADYISEWVSLNGGTAYDETTFPLMASFMDLVNYMGVSGVVLYYGNPSVSTMVDYMDKLSKVVEFVKYGINKLNTDNGTSLTMGLIALPLGFSQTTVTLADVNAVHRDDTKTDTNGAAYAGSDRLLFGGWTDASSEVSNYGTAFDFVIVPGFSYNTDALNSYTYIDPILAYQEARGIIPSTVPVHLGMIVGKSDVGNEVLMTLNDDTADTAPSNTLLEYTQYDDALYTPYSVQSLVTRFLGETTDIIQTNDGFCLEGPYRPTNDASPDTDASAATPTTAGQEMSLISGIGTDTTTDIDGVANES